MTFWLRIFSELIPFGLSVVLFLVGVYCPLIHRNEKVLAAYLVGVVIFSIAVHLIWIKP